MKTLFTLDSLVAEGLVAEDWGEALMPVSENILRVGEFLYREREAGQSILPLVSNIWRSFRDPLTNVRVLVVGQDPYPTPGHSIGLAFSTERHVTPIPRSLKNIYRELEEDLGIPIATVGDLSSWASQGVMLLNRVLSVRAGESDSHSGQGWEEITECAIRVLVARGSPLVAVLWGSKARTLKPLLAGVPVVESAHPSPLSAARGFFGSKPFSSVNNLLKSQNTKPIDWKIE